jgi:hypothetical protein
MRQRPLPCHEPRLARALYSRSDLGAPLATPRASCAERRSHACQPAGGPFTRLADEWRFIAFLIGTPRLEFRATPTKQTPDPFSNRDRSRCLRPPSRTHLSHHRFSPWSLATHLTAGAKTPCVASPLTSHKSPVTSHDFLIYGAAIRTPRKALKT